MGKGQILYTGTYSNEQEPGILGYRQMESGECAGEFTSEFCYRGIENPSYLAVTSKQTYLYAVSETMTFDGKKEGSVAAFRIGEQGLELLNRTGSGGTLPCHVLLDESRGFLFVSNYLSGSLSMFSLRENGEVGRLWDCKNHVGCGLHPGRQEGPHVHFSGFSGDGKGIWCVDLGIDRVVYYEIDETDKKMIPVKEKDLILPGGVGPRHFVLNPGNRHVMYLICELSSEIFVMDTGVPGGRVLQRISTLDSQGGGKESTCAAVRISPDGRFLYASNRGDDSIAVFLIDEKTKLLTLKEIVPTMGRTPRDIALWGNRLLAANQDGGGITVFEMDGQGGLCFTGQTLNCDRPVSLVVGEDG